MNLSEALQKFDSEFHNKRFLDRSLVTVDGKFTSSIELRNAQHVPLEEYYKWQFIYGLIVSTLYPPDHIGTEVYFPKGNISSDPIKIDAVLFTDSSWIDFYRQCRTFRDPDSLQRLRELTIGVIEFKRGGKKIEQVFNSQIRAALKEPDATFVLGAYYDTRRLYLFKKVNGVISRLDNSRNFPNSQRVSERFQLEITDPYFYFPPHLELVKLNEGATIQPLAARRIEHLDVIYTVHDERIKTALNKILRSLDRVSMVDEEGYIILIQLFAIKIFDEKQSDLHGSLLRFFITSDELKFRRLQEDAVQVFIKRMSNLYEEARRYYKHLLDDRKIDWANENHARATSEIVNELQSFSFARSRKTDLYQLVFYNFATAFKKDEHAQFLTPLPIIGFLVDIVNPRRNETVLDPCCGSGDFLSVSYVSSTAKLDDRNLYGMDNDRKMVLLSELNMVLNGDGNATIAYVPETGALTQKLTDRGDIAQLDEQYHRGGMWEKWVDQTRLFQVDVVLTNPPFGKGRSLDLSKGSDKHAAQFYHLYEEYVKESPKEGLDPGILFLENAVRSIKLGGRFAIVLSNSIASNKTWWFARDWLLGTVRLVALFDLPPNVFAETGVNTTLVVGYKPRLRPLADLIRDDYSVFTREIGHVGYEKRTSNRNIVFQPKFRLDPTTFETVINRPPRCFRWVG